MKITIIDPPQRSDLLKSIMAAGAVRHIDEALINPFSWTQVNGDSTTRPGKLMRSRSKVGARNIFVVTSMG